MEEVNNLLKRLGELEDAPLIWINKKVYDMAQEIERLKEENTILKQTMSNNSLLINENAFLKERIDKAIEYIDKELCNINIQENIMAKNELLKIKSIIQGDDKE